MAGWARPRLLCPSGGDDIVVILRYGYDSSQLSGW
jgi:hypothetical protein